MGPLKPLMKKQVTIDEAANTVSMPRSPLDVGMKPLKPSKDLTMKPTELSMVAELVPNGRFLLRGVIFCKTNLPSSVYIFCKVTAGSAFHQLPLGSLQKV